MRQRKVHGRLGRLGSRHFVVESWQRFVGHYLGKHLRQVVPQRVVVMKPIAPMRRIDHLENLRVRIANRIGCPAVLKINVASAVEIPDEITFNVINNDLVCRPKTAAAGFLEFFVESKAITK